MSKITLGKNCNLDIEKLIATRMLINANSGGGKSWAIRRLLEQSNGKIQQIVIDLEGEFSTLREKYDDYLIVGKEGDVPIDIRSSEMLAKKLLMLNVSTIIDLSELKHHERILFVKRFLDSLINSTKNLWHPVLIIVDEAHQFCPEKTKSESASSVIDLMTRGRKRGFCGVLATQRISKLNKDAAAEANNYMTGRTGLDIDQKRAGEILGFTSKEDIRNLRNLDAGEFFIFGPAFNQESVEKIKVGGINTTHPDRTKGISMSDVPTKTSDKIKELMKDLGDLPKEAEEELRTINDYKKKIKELKTRVTIAEKNQTKVVENASEAQLERAKEQGIRQGIIESQNEINSLRKELAMTQKKLADIGKIIGKEITISAPKRVSVPTPVSVPRKKVTEVTHISNQPVSNISNGNSLRAGAMKMLNWLAGAYPDSLTKQRLATLSGFAVKGGTFNTYISELKRNGWIVGGNDLAITEDGLKNAEPCQIPSGEELLALWKGKFRAGAGYILETLYNNYPNGMSKEALGLATDFEPTGGTFNTYVSELKRNGLVKVEDGEIKISGEFFE